MILKRGTQELRRRHLHINFLIWLTTSASANHRILPAHEYFFHVHIHGNISLIRALPKNTYFFIFRKACQVTQKGRRNIFICYWSCYFSDRQVTPEILICYGKKEAQAKFKTIKFPMWGGAQNIIQSSLVEYDRLIWVGTVTVQHQIELRRWRLSQRHADSSKFGQRCQKYQSGR